MSSSVGLIVEVLTSSYFWFLVCCSFASMYATIMLYIAYLLRVSAWLTIVPPLIPLTVTWFFVLRKRTNNYITLLLAPQKTYDVDKTLKEYTELLENQKHEKTNKKEK